MHDHRLLADDLARSLSANALQHLREARISRHAALSAPPERLRAMLMERGLPVYEPLLELEARAGGAAFPHERILGAACFLNAVPSLRMSDLPTIDGKAAFPVYGIIDHFDEWESPFGVMSATGAIAMFDAPRGPAPAFSSLEHFVENLALAPLSDSLHTLRADAYCGDTLAGLVDAFPHPPADGERVAGWIGDAVWVRELRIELPDERKWSSQRGTFVCAERAELLVDLIPLLLEQGISLGYRGPVVEAPPGEQPVMSFVDEYPEVGFRARARVSVWGSRDRYAFSRRIEPFA